MADSTNVFSTSPGLVTGKIYAANYAVPTPSNLTSAVGCVETAYTDAASRSLPDFKELAVGNIGGLTLSPGLYNWTNSVNILNDITISGSPTDTWIFQIAGDLNLASGKRVTLAGGAFAQTAVTLSGTTVTQP